MHRGQALVVILMILAVATAVGLAVITRTTSEVSLSSTQEESATALSAAEAGIEAAMSNIAAPGVDVNVGTSATYQVGAAVAPPATTDRSFTQEFKSGEVATLFLNSSPSNNQPLTNQSPSSWYGGNLNICWGDRDKTVQAPAPAVEMLVYYLNAGNFTTGQVTFDPGNHGNGFTSTPPGGVTYVQNPNNTTQCPAGKNYRYALTGLNRTHFGAPANSMVIMRIKMLFNDVESYPIGVKGSANLPAQGTTTLVEGKSGNTVRKIQITRDYPDPLPIFDNALFSGGNL